MKQLAIVETSAAPKLTARQQAILDAVTKTGTDGLHADEAGAIAHGLKEGRWAHGPDERCEYCGRDGNAILRALRTKGLVRYRRGRDGKPGYWEAIVNPEDRVMPPAYNTFPEDF